VETDPAALNSAEDLDEDRLQVDPLEAGMDPPEHWSAADRRGMTPWEQAHSAPLDERLAEEEPDVVPEPADVPGSGERQPAEAEVTDDDTPDVGTDHDRDQGISADVAGGSVTHAIRTPPPAE
jgi:hypothetical protein